MIILNQAICIAFSKAQPMDTETVDFMQSSGRIPVQDVFADVRYAPIQKTI